MQSVKETAKIGKGKPGPGRPKGLPNKTTQSAKDAIAFAADALGGGQRLVDWVKEDEANEKAFWTVIYPKLLPVQLANSEGGDLFETFGKVVREIVRPHNKDS